MGNPITFFEYISPDAARTREFYAALFGWRFQYNPATDYSVVQAGDDGPMGGIGSATPENDQRVTVYADVDDVQAYLDKAEGLGAKTVQPPTEIPGYGTVGMFADPGGQLTGLWKRT